MELSACTDKPGNRNSCGASIAFLKASGWVKGGPCCRWWMEPFTSWRDGNAGFGTWPHHLISCSASLNPCPLWQDTFCTMWGSEMMEMKVSWEMWRTILVGRDYLQNPSQAPGPITERNCKHLPAGPAWWCISVKAAAGLLTVIFFFKPLNVGRLLFSGPHSKVPAPEGPAALVTWLYTCWGHLGQHLFSSWCSLQKTRLPWPHVA